MKWFKHFSNAHNDNALNKVRMRYGAEGYAIYWYCLELIAGDLEGENANFELSHDAEVIGFNLKIDQLKVEEIMRYMVDLKLFEQSDSTITCLKMAKFLDKKTTRNKEIHKIIDSFNDISNVADKYEIVADKSKQSRLEEKRREENRNIIANRKTTISNDFSPNEANIKFAQDNHLNLSHELEQFKNHALANGKKYIDWQAALRTWLGNAKKWDKPSSDKQQPFVMRSI